MKKFKYSGKGEKQMKMKMICTLIVGPLVLTLVMCSSLWASTFVFRDADGAFSWTDDCHIASEDGYEDFSSGHRVKDYIGNATRRQRYLVAFRNIIGNRPGQIALGSTIVSAELWLHNYTDSRVDTAGADVTTSYLLKDWANSMEGNTNPYIWEKIVWPAGFGATWNAPTRLVDNSGSLFQDSWDSPGASGVLDSTQVCTTTIPSIVSLPWPDEYALISPDVSVAVQAWAGGAPNYGLMVFADANIAGFFYTRDASDKEKRPKLIVEVVGTTETVSLGNGWSFFSPVSTTPLLWSAVNITDGVDTYTIAQAEAQGWIQGTVYFFDETKGVYQVVPGDSDTVSGAEGYWLWTTRAGLTLEL
jgi:hypothetical protein